VSDESDVSFGAGGAPKPNVGAAAAAGFEVGGVGEAPKLKAGLGVELAEAGGAGEKLDPPNELAKGELEAPNGLAAGAEGVVDEAGAKGLLAAGALPNPPKPAKGEGFCSGGVLSALEQGSR
jgi:hypothetical protein